MAPRLVDIRNHKPSILHRLPAKLLHIPLLGVLRCQSQVDYHQSQAAQHGFVDYLAGWCGEVRERQVDDALGPVVRAHDAAEDRMIRESVFL